MRHHIVAGRLRHLRGWKRDRADHRDRVLAPLPGLVMPVAAGPKQFRPPRYDQEAEGSCTANAAGGALRLLRRRLGKPDYDPARQFFYYITRVLIEGTPSAEDSGASIRDTMKAWARFGVCSEALWPYDTSPLDSEPEPACFSEAVHHKLDAYNACPTIESIKQMLALGYPVVFGFSVPQNMMSDECAKSGFVRYPAPYEASAGGHAVFTDWYDDHQVVPGEDQPGAFMVVNSWGTAWGLRDMGNEGCFWLPYRFFQPIDGRDPLADDAWTPRLEGEAP